MEEGVCGDVAGGAFVEREADVLPGGGGGAREVFPAADEGEVFYNGFN